MLRTLFILTGIVTFMLAGAGFYIFTDLRDYAQSPQQEGQSEKIVEILPGHGFAAVMETLKKERIVDDPLRFRLIALFKGYDRQIKAGEYLLSLSMSPLEILENIAKGKIYLRRFTIPEGYTLRQIAIAVSEAGLGKESEFTRLASDMEFIKKSGIRADSLEGYLFPDTYFFPKSTGIPTILMTMIRRFHSVFTEEWEKRAQEIGFSVHEIVTLASIIEKETGNPAERPLISSVFHNRLKKKMRLQTDPTVIYGIENFDGNLTRKHLETLTPYNTYQISGLPPGPIASPGEKSLHAALWPAQTEYLYFVSKGDKTHEFSATLEDHNRAVRKYQLSGK
ncbi:MAG: endolytic transglycosylase MltG [Desulfococcaceae bacterium]